MARLTSAGVYSTTSQPASTAARIATPLAWPSFRALRAFTAWNRLSTATHSGRCEEGRQLTMDAGQALGKRIAGTRGDRAAGNQLMAPPVGLDAAVAGALRA